ncbi:MAG: hypothetical protein ACXW6V_26450, partial [Candidatus Binatia bacterium]
SRAKRRSGIGDQGKSKKLKGKNWDRISNSFAAYGQLTPFLLSFRFYLFHFYFCLSFHLPA